MTLSQMLSEYRALRASVLRLWAQAHREAGPADVEEITRFNEAIDQAVTLSTDSSVSTLSSRAEYTTPMCTSMV